MTLATGSPIKRAGIQVDGRFSLLRSVKIGLAVGMLPALVGCAPSYSPDTYSANAVQQANKVEPGVVIGFRQVTISANGTVGAVTGGAVGGVLGGQSGTIGINSALGAVGGTAVGGLIGTTIEHATSDTTGWEYIVRKPNGDLLSVTQREPAPIPLGQKVLVITGSQARIVADYSVAVEPPQSPGPAQEKTEQKEKAAAKETPAPASTSRLAAPAAARRSPETTAPDAEAPTATPVPAPTDANAASSRAAPTIPSPEAPPSPAMGPPPQAAATPPAGEVAAPSPAATVDPSGMPSSHPAAAEADARPTAVDEPAAGAPVLPPPGPTDTDGKIDDPQAASF
jgi:outer membrane lipoprotein SlyB